MTKERKILIVILIVIAVIAIISFFRTGKDSPGPKQLPPIEKLSTVAPKLDEIPNSLTDNKVVLMYFFTSSCSNCEAVTPHLNAWYDKYSNSGLQIIGIHSPEFEFEKDSTHRENTAKKLELKFPVIPDNEFKIWNAYKNDVWPKVYVVNREGNITYSHAGEGAYYQTEANIRAALNEGAAKINESPLLDTDPSVPAIPGTIDTYLGSGRNEQLGQGEIYLPGIQKLSLPLIISLNKFYLAGDWEFNNEFTENKTGMAKIVLKYNAKEVYLVAGSIKPNQLSLLQDGQKSEVTISIPGLYKLLTNPTAGEHTLEITVLNPGLQAYVFRFR